VTSGIRAASSYLAGEILALPQNNLQSPSRAAAATALPGTPLPPPPQPPQSTPSRPTSPFAEAIVHTKKQLRPKKTHPPTLTFRMATVEDKIETLIGQVKEIQLEQVKHYSKLDDVVTWKDTA
jgi:hypothetical protein